MTSDRKEVQEVAVDSSQSGKIGKALLMWMLGVPGIIVVAYLLFAN